MKKILIIILSFLMAVTTLMPVFALEDNQTTDETPTKAVEAQDVDEVVNAQDIVDEAVPEAVPKEDTEKPEEKVTKEKPKKDIKEEKEEELPEVKTKEAESFAYAVLRDNGDLIFFRSTETYTNDTTGEFVDIDDREYAGRVFAGFENSYSAPWNTYTYRSNIKNVKFAQTISPTYAEGWFQYMTLESIDFTNFDASNLKSVASMFYQISIDTLDLSWFANIESKDSLDKYGFLYYTDIRTIILPEISTKYLRNNYYGLEPYYISENNDLYDPRLDDYTLPAGTYNRVEKIKVSATIKASDRVSLPQTIEFADEDILVGSTQQSYEKELKDYDVFNNYDQWFHMESDKYQLFVTEDENSTGINRRYTLTIDVPLTSVSGKIEWQEDNIADRPENVTLGLYQNGTLIDTQTISSSATSYEFTPPVADENGAIYDYEVKEEPVPNYVTTYRDYDAIELKFNSDYGPKLQALLEKRDGVSGFYFRRNGKWYYMTWNENYRFRDRLIIPGDAVYIKYTQSSGPIFQSLKSATSDDYAVQFIPYDMDDASTKIADSWASYDTGKTINVKTWYNRNQFLRQYEEDGKITITSLPYTNEEMAQLDDFKGEVYDSSTGNYTEGNLPKIPLNNMGRYYYPLSDTVYYGSLFTTDIKNVSKNTKIEISGKKIWADEDREPPAEVTIRLLQDGKIFKEITTTAGKDWAYTFEDVPKYNSEGEEYVYTLSEKPIKGYKYTIDSSHKGLKVSFRLADSLINDVNGYSDWWYDDVEFISEYDGNYYGFGSQIVDRSSSKYSSSTSYRNRISPGNICDEDGNGVLYFPTTNIYMVFMQSNNHLAKSSPELKALPDEWLKITDVELVDNPYTYNEVEDSYFWNNKDGGSWEKLATPIPNEILSNLDTKGLHEPWTLYDLGYSKKEYDYDGWSSYKYDGVNYDINYEEINVINKYYEGSLCVNKKDEAGNPLKNTLFSLYWTENTLLDDEWTKAETNPTATGLTDEEGNLVITNIPYGCYIMEETPAPGYSTPSKPWKVVINANGTATVFDENGELVPIAGTTVSQDTTNGLRLTFDDSYPNNAVLYYELDGDIYQVTKELTGTIDIPSKKFYISAYNLLGELFPEWSNNGTPSEKSLPDKSLKGMLLKLLSVILPDYSNDYTIPKYYSGGVETTVRLESVEPRNVNVDNKTAYWAGSEEDLASMLDITPIADISEPIVINAEHDLYSYTYVDPNYLVSPEREQEWSNSKIQIKFGDVTGVAPNGEVAIFVSDGTKHNGEYFPTHYLKLTDSQLAADDSTIHYDGFYVTDVNALANKTITVPGVKVWIIDNWAQEVLPVNPAYPPVGVSSELPSQKLLAADSKLIEIESISLVDTNETTAIYPVSELDPSTGLFIEHLIYAKYEYGINPIISLTGNTQTLNPQTAWNSIWEQVLAMIGKEPPADFDSNVYGFAAWSFEKPALQNDPPLYEVDNQKTRTEIKLINTVPEMVPGGVLELYDKDNNLVERWTTDDKVHVVLGLTEGETYTVKNPSAPFIYNPAPDKEFEVLVGDVTRVELVVTPAPKVEVTNEIVGGGNDELTYEVNLEGAHPNATYPISIGTNTVNIPTDANGNGTATFKLKDGEMATIKPVHQGTKVTVEEKASNYYAQYVAKQGGDTIESKKNDNSNTAISTSNITMTNDDLRIDFRNILNIPSVTGRERTTFGALIIILSAALVLVLMKRRSLTNKAHE